MRETPLRPVPFHFFVGLLAAGSVAGCFGLPQSAPAPAAPTADWIERAKERWPDTSEAELQAGRRSFMESCNECHGHPDVTSLREDEWPPTIERMSGKAKLSDEQSQAVLRFVLTARARVMGARGAFEAPKEGASSDPPRSGQASPERPE